MGTAAYAADDLGGIPEETYSEFMAGEIRDERDLAAVAEIQRRWFNRITPPGISWFQPMFPSVAPFDAAGFSESFLDGLLGEDRNSVAVYPLSLALDPKTRETLVHDADGKLIAILPSDGVFHAWPEDADPARVVLQLDLLPSEDAEPYLYVEGRVAEFAKARVAKPAISEGMVLRSLGANEFGFAGAHRLTNGQMRLTATNGMDVAEIYSYTVWHTSSVVVTVWTNEYDEVVTSTNLVWDPVSPPYAGIESEWACQTTNLVLSGGVGTWDDADVSTNARVRFYAAAKRIDSDEDGLTDGAEIFLYRTDPGLPDSDGDGVGDGVEVGQGGDPLDPAKYPVDPDLEAALAGINVAQIGYLSYLCDLSFPYDPSANYAQCIQMMREALEGLAGSFLDLDVNVDGVLAERTSVVVWTLDTVLSSTGNESGDWLEGLATTSQVEEIAAVLGQLTHLVHEGSLQTGYPHLGIATQAAPFMVGSPFDLGTGYPEDWPTNQPIKTYLLLDTKIDIPNVGLGTVDDWIEVNGTARFPSYGEIYTNHVADISAPTWNPTGTNRLELWDCGDCAGSNDYAYLSPFQVIQVLEVPPIEVEMVESDLSAGPDFDAVINAAGKLWVRGGAQWSATIQVTPLEAKEHVVVRLLQTIKGAMRRIYRSPSVGVTGSKTDSGAVWHFDGSSETADWTDIGAFYQLVNGDTPTLIDDPVEWTSLGLDLEFDVFIQYRIDSGPWLTLEKGSWSTQGVGEAIPDGGGGYSADGIIESTVMSDFGASSDAGVETPKWADLDWEDY